MAQELRMKSSPDVADRFTIGDNEQFVIESLGSNLRLPAKYNYARPVGSGGGGMTGEDVAIKKIQSPFVGPEMAKRCLREIHLLRTIHHQNVLIVSLKDAFLGGHGPDLYFVMKFLPMDLRRRLADQEPLPIEITRRYAYQLLKALAYMHDRGVVHRDMKPENLLLDTEGNLLVCDLGLARPADHHMTGYVSTRFYRAPEIMLSWKNYTESVDLWSAGCIISEMLTGHILFPGMDHVHHMNLILELLGSPSETVLDKICGEKTKGYLMMLPHQEGLDMRTSIYASEAVPDLAVDLMQRLLVLDPTVRITAAQAVQHPFFDSVREAEMDEAQDRHSYDSAGFDQLSLEELRAAIEAEVGLFESGRSRDLIEPNPLKQY